MATAYRVKRTVCIALLVVWLALHAVALVKRETWWFAFWLVLSGPVYIGIVHWLDRTLNLGGAASLPRPQIHETGASEAKGQSSAMANQTVSLTTGFAAVLLFNAVRFHSDLSVQNRYDGKSERILVVAAVSFCLVCILNLVQLLILRLSDRHEANIDFTKRLRRMLRFLSGIAWHSLLTPVVLLLMLLGSSVPALLVNAFYGICLYTYYFAVVPKLQTGSLAEG